MHYSCTLAKTALTMKRFLLYMPIFFLSYSLTAQNVGIGTSNPTAKLDIVSTNSGLLIPRVSLISTNLPNPCPPITSLLVYNTAPNNDVTPGFYFWDGTSWRNLIDRHQDLLLSLNGTTLSIADGNSVVLPAPIPDDQTLSITGNTLSIADGNSVVLPSSAPSLWNTSSSGSFIYRATGMAGIGTTLPNSTLHVNAPNATANAIFRAQLDGSTRLMVASNGNTALYFNNSPSYKLELDVNSAAKPTSSAWTVASDARLKTEVTSFQDGLNVIMDINPVWFRYNGKAGMPVDEKGVGTIAQELKKIAPYMVNEWTYEEGSLDESAPTSNQPQKYTTYLGVDYGALDFILINSIKEQQKIIEDQNKEIQDLKEMNSSLSQSIIAIQTHLGIDD